MATFTLTIELGNEAMQTADNVAEVLVKLAEQLPFVAGNPKLYPGFWGGIRDLNGNRVGGWGIES